MAEQTRPLQVGDVVYRLYAGNTAGKVVTDLGIHFPPHRMYQNMPPHLHRFYQTVEVRWAKKGNPITEERGSDLNLLEDLITDHEKKLEGHRERFQKAQAL